jgi:cbb3-type cytochrome oxidase maturation protein
MMNEDIVATMLAVSTFLGALGLIAFIWGLRTKQFDDQDKLMQGVLFDDEDTLNRLAKKESRKEEAMKEQKEKSEL